MEQIAWQKQVIREEYIEKGAVNDRTYQILGAWKRKRTVNVGSIQGSVITKAQGTRDRRTDSI
jgi:hypothetical protein